VTNKETTDSGYIGNNESVSSFLIIKAASIVAAQLIAKKCPILDFNDSVEIRPLMLIGN
jgi:hypothetical protein